MRYKAILTDVDRTLIAERHALPNPAIRAAIKRLHGKAHFGLATSRPFNQILDICEYLNLSGPSIVSGGAQIVNVRSGEYYVEYLLDRDVIYKILSILENFDEKITYWIQDNGFDREFNRSYSPEKPFVIVISELSLNTAHRLANLFTHLQSIFITKTPTYKKGIVDIQISNVRATKQHGVINVARILGIKPFEIIGVGDGYNDYPLLMASGKKVAMGNAVEEIKEIAHYVTKSVEYDGLAEVIKKYFY